MDDLLLTSRPLSEERPARADAVKNRELLLRVAARLFEAKGVENVTMSDIAQEAGVGKGTLYRHFSHKTELCYALLDEDQRSLQQATIARLNAGEYSPQESLCWFVDQVASFGWRHLDFLNTTGEVNGAFILHNRAHLWWQQTIFALLQRSDKVQTETARLRYYADTLYVMLAPITLGFQRSQGRSLSDISAGLHQLVASFLPHNP